jgi:hypothetical protein
MRALYGSIGNWQRLYEQAFHALRPGAYLEHFEISISVHSAARASIDESSDGNEDSESEPDETTHIFDIWNAEMHEAADEWGRSFRMAEDGSMKSSFQAAGYVDVVEQRFEIPIGCWSQSSDDEGRKDKIGRCAAEFWDQSIEGFALFLLKQVQGWQYERIMELVGEMRVALRDESLKPWFQGYVTHYPSEDNLDTDHYAILEALSMGESGKADGMHGCMPLLMLRRVSYLTPAYLSHGRVAIFGPQPHVCIVVLITLHLQAATQPSDTVMSADPVLPYPSTDTI